jgi:hypothetical protein
MAEILAIKNGIALPGDMNVAQAKDRLSLTPDTVDAMACGVSETAH